MTKKILLPSIIILLILYFAKDMMGSSFIILKPLLVPVIHALNDQAFVFLASFALFISAFFVSGLFYFNRVKPANAKQRTLQQAIRSLPHAENAKDKKADDAVNAMLLLLQKESLYISAIEQWNDDRLARNRFPSTPFRDYADKSREERGSNMGDAYDAMPSYFTTIGLILTFVGLVAALYFAAAGFKSGNYEEAKAAIIQLLNASSFKFLTSVAALIGSFIISLALRFGQNKIEQERLTSLTMIEAYLNLWKNKTSITQASNYHSLEVAINALNDTLKAHFKAL